MIPVQVPGLEFGVQSYSRNGAECAVISGAVKCWGQVNTDGRLGNGTTTPSATPTQVTGLTSGATVVAVGGEHACAIVNEGLWCWGGNRVHQVGDGGVTNRLTPYQPKDASGNAIFASGVKAVSASSLSTCAIANGKVYCWGYWGGTYANTPRQLTGTLEVTSLATNYQGGCAVAGGEVYCWGLNEFGLIGIAPELNNYQGAIKVQGFAASVREVTGGGWSMCAALANNAVQCWGRVITGANMSSAGTPRTGNHTPTTVPGLPAGEAISMSPSNICAVISGIGQCLGYNEYGALGDGTLISRMTPAPVSGLSGLVITPPKK